MPEKQIARRRQIATYLNRHSEFSETPEAQLGIAVLAQAWEDAVGSLSTRDGYEDAHKFFTDGRANLWADVIGFVGDIQELFAKHGPERVELETKALRVAFVRNRRT